MADPARPAAALRIPRPYASEDQLIDGDLDGIGRSWLVLPGVGPRAIGEVVRFEILLENGTSVIRGEGRVVTHRAAPDGKPAGLEVKLTRMDAKTKMVLDRADARKATRGRPPAMSLVDGAEVTGVDLRAPEPAATELHEPRPAPALDPKPPSDRPSEHSGVHVRVGGPVAPPANREEILERLRSRAKGLASTTIATVRTGEKSG